MIKEVRKVGYACGFKVLRRADVVVYTGIPGSGIPKQDGEQGAGVSGGSADKGTDVSGEPAGAASETSSSQGSSTSEGDAPQTAVPEEKSQDVLKCENWNKLLYASGQPWPIEKNIHEFNHQGEDIYKDVYRAADIILTMNKFILLSDPTGGERFRKYVEGGGYLVIDFMEFRTRIRKFLNLRGTDMASEGKLAKMLEEYLIRRGVFVRLDSPEIIQEYTILVDTDESLMRVVDLREINEVYYSDFCKHWDILLGDDNNIFLSVEKVIDKFGVK